MTSLKSTMRNTSILLSGNVLAQVINLCLLPVVAKIYGPAAFGVFAIYSQLVSIFGEVANGRYEFALIIPDADREAKNLFILSLIVLLCTCIILSLGFLVFGGPALRLLKINDSSGWYLFVPLGVCAYGLFNLLSNWAIRNQKFYRISGSSFTQSLSNNLLKILFGKLTQGMISGLIWGKILADMLANVVFINWGSLPGSIKALFTVSVAELKACAVKYGRFPKLGVPSKMLNLIVVSLPSFLLMWFYSREVVGNYFMAYNLLILPVSILGSAMSKSIAKDMARMRNDSELLNRWCRKVYNSIFLLTIIPFALLFIFIRIPIDMFFDAKWSSTIDFIRILIPSMFILFLNTPFFQLTDILGKQGFFLYYNMSLFVIRSLAIWLGAYYFNDPNYSLLFFSISSVITGFVYMRIIFSYTKDCPAY